MFFVGGQSGLPWKPEWYFLVILFGRRLLPGPLCLSRPERGRAQVLERMAGPDLWKEKPARQPLECFALTHPSRSLRLAGWEEGRGSHLRVSSPRWQVPRRPVTVSHTAHQDSQARCWGKNIHPRDSLESLSEPWPRTAFPGSAKAISQLSPQGGEIRSAQCVAGRCLFLCRRNPPLQTHQMFLSPRQAQSEEFKSAEGDR